MIDDESVVLHAGLRRDIAYHLEFLDDLHQAVLHHRYGLGGHNPSTIEETAAQLSLPPDRIRVLEREALRQLRRRAHHHLRDYAA